MKLADLPRALQLEAERSRLLSSVHDVEAGELVVIMGGVVADEELARAATVPLRMKLYSRLSSNARQLEQIGVRLD